MRNMIKMDLRQDSCNTHIVLMIGLSKNSFWKDHFIITK